MNVDEIIKENKIRIKKYFTDHNPLIGDPASATIYRYPLKFGNVTFWVPMTMKKIPIVKKLESQSPEQIIQELTGTCTNEQLNEFYKGFTRDRLAHDFEFAAFSCLKIQDKLSKAMIPFKLNYGQRKLVCEMEKMRLEGIPIRILLVKARQWGGSTLVQMYMFWLQTFHYTNWHSAIVTQFKQQASNIRGMITKTINQFPKDVANLSFKGYEGQQGLKMIPTRGCIIGTASAENPDATRSFDFSMIHMSEVGLWRSTPTKSAEDLVQSLYSTVPDVPGTLIVMESTAKGVGNFFHKEYLASASGTSQNRLVFVAWYEIMMYASFKMKDAKIIIENGLPVSMITDYKAEIEAWTPYNISQWNEGATIEGIKWYNAYKKAKNFSDFQMKSEYPTTATEAFQTHASRYFELEHTNYCKSTIMDPIFIGDIRGQALTGEQATKNIHLVESNGEELCIFAYPDKTKYTEQYIVSVDIGGKSYKADWSTINIFDRTTLSDPYGALERVATWRGHIDHDILAWKAVQLAIMFNNALLVIESNTLETKDRKQIDSIYEGDHFYTVLNEIAPYYDNLYTREVDPDRAKQSVTYKYGWHMNKRTKYLAYDVARSKIREREYIERDRRAVDEMEWLEIKKDGTLGAIDGEHDDIIDPTVVAIYVSDNEMGIPKPMSQTNKYKSRQTISVATI